MVSLWKLYAAVLLISLVAFEAVNDVAAWWPNWWGNTTTKYDYDTLQMQEGVGNRLRDLETIVQEEDPNSPTNQMRTQPSVTARISSAVNIRENPICRYTVYAVVTVIFVIMMVLFALSGTDNLKKKPKLELPTSPMPTTGMPTTVDPFTNTVLNNLAASERPIPTEDVTNITMTTDYTTVTPETDCRRDAREFMEAIAENCGKANGRNIFLYETVENKNNTAHALAKEKTADLRKCTGKEFNISYEDERTDSSDLGSTSSPSGTLSAILSNSTNANGTEPVDSVNEGSNFVPAGNTYFYVGLEDGICKNGWYEKYCNTEKKFVCKERGISYRKKRRSYGRKKRTSRFK